MALAQAIISAAVTAIKGTQPTLLAGDTESYTQTFEEMQSEGEDETPMARGFEVFASAGSQSDATGTASPSTELRTMRFRVVVRYPNPGRTVSQHTSLIGEDAAKLQSTIRNALNILNGTLGVGGVHNCLVDGDYIIDRDFNEPSVYTLKIGFVVEYVDAIP